MRRKNLWLRLSSCTMAALLAATSITPAYGADFGSEIAVESQQEDATAEDEEEIAVADDFEAEETAEDAEVGTEVATEDAEDEATEFADEENATESETEEFTDAAGEEAATFKFGTAKTKLEAGTYSIKASLMNASNISNASMAGSCIAGKATLVVDAEGKATVTVPITSVSVGKLTGYASDWKIYNDYANDKTNTTATTFTTDDNDKVNSITFAVPDTTTDGVYVSLYVDIMAYAPDAYLKLDYASAIVNTTDLEATIAKADALKEESYTKASWDANKEAIDAANTAAKAALAAKESQEAVDAANTALTEALAKLEAAGDPTELQAAIDQAKALEETDYTVKSVQDWWNKLQTAITDAETAISGRETTQKLASSKSSLETAVGRLVKVYDTTALTQKITEAEALKEEDYTADSWKAANLTAAISRAKDVIDMRGSKDDVKGAINDLENTIDKLVPISVEVTVGRGDFQKKLTAGTYSLPIDLLNAGASHIKATEEYTTIDYMKHTSMASGCFTGNATLVIHEDGTATLTTGLGTVTSDIAGNGTQTGGADQWTIYENTQDFINGDANSENGARFNARIDKRGMLANKAKPTQISFTVPDLKQNVVATRMHIEIMGCYQDAFIGLDWKNVKRVSDDTSATSTVEKTYVVAPDVQTQLLNMKAGSNVKLDADITLTDDLTIKGGTLDLNGHTLNQADNLIRIKGNVKIIDSSAEHTGKIIYEKYASNTNSTVSITVEKGSLTAERIAIDGQLGNEMYYNSKNHLTGLPHVSVSLRNCTLTNTLSASCIYFEDYANGLDLTVDGCTVEKGFIVSSCNGENVTITNSKLWIYQQTATTDGTTVFTGNETSGSVYINTGKLTIKDDKIGSGLILDVNTDTVLENMNITASGRSDVAVTADGIGTVTVKSGIYTSTGKRGIVFESVAAPMMIEGGYFKGYKITKDAKYRTPAGKKLGEVTEEGDYKGYTTVVDDKDGTVADPVATIYNADGTVAKKIGKAEAAWVTAFAEEGQTIKLEEDISATYETSYRNIILDLNGHTMTLSQALVANYGTCHVIDSSADKSGKIVSKSAIFNATKNGNSGLILDNVTCEAPALQYSSIGKLYVINGTKINGVTSIDPIHGGNGSTYIQDSTWTFGEGADGQKLLENFVRTAQYTITKGEDNSFTVAVTDFGKSMRDFEALDESAYTKASYKAAKDLYDEIDKIYDPQLTEEQKTAFQNALAALKPAASETELASLSDAVKAAKSLKASDYTAASWKTLTDAIAAAEKVLSGDPSKEEAQEAIQAVNDAKAKLVKAPATVKVTAQAISVASTNVTRKFGSAAFNIGAKAKGKLSYSSSNTKVAVVDANGKVTLKGVGTAVITVNAAAGSDFKAASTKVTIKVTKGTPVIKAKTTSRKLKAAKVKKKAQKISLGASVTGNGKMSFKKLSGNKAITVNKKTGKITVKKGLKKGTYKVKIRVTAKASANYNAGKKTVTVKIKVK